MAIPQRQGSNGAGASSSGAGPSRTPTGSTPPVQHVQGKLVFGSRSPPAPAPAPGGAGGKGEQTPQDGEGGQDSFKAFSGKSYRLG